ncbi:MAG: hypothetical protein WDO73_09605 [Ignavibacteriota bacterium]
MMSGSIDGSSAQPEQGALPYVEQAPGGGSESSIAVRLAFPRGGAMRIAIASHTPPRCKL